MSMYDKNREEIFHLAGDLPRTVDNTVDPAWQKKAHVTSMEVPKTEVQIRYKDTIIFADVYEAEGAPIRVILLCPKCRNALTISGDNKRVEYSFSSAPTIGGRISIEPFKCSFEAPDAGAHRQRSGDVTIIAGTKMCGWKVGVENNKALDA